MSVIMTARFQGDPAAMAKVDTAAMMRILADARARGLTHHRFVGGKGEILVIDEWPSAEAFQGFFQANEQEITSMLGDAISGPPEITFWENLDMPDTV